MEVDSSCNYGDAGVPVGAGGPRRMDQASGEAKWGAILKVDAYLY